MLGASLLKHARCGLALARLGRDSEALEALDRAGPLRPGDTELLNIRGNVLRSLQRYTRPCGASTPSWPTVRTVPA